MSRPLKQIPAKEVKEIVNKHLDSLVKIANKSSGVISIKTLKKTRNDIILDISDL